VKEGDDDPMRVIAFNGSPHIAGNTSFALETVLDEFKKEGMETELVQMGSETVEPCQACYVCLQNLDGRCIIETDSINKWFEDMKAADAIVIGSPVFFGGVTAQTKAFLDRMGELGKANKDPFRRKLGGGVVVRQRAGALNAFNEINLFFLDAQMILVGSGYNTLQARVPGEARNDPEGMETLRTLGRNMVWALRRLGENHPG
jgi:multimeric flavodoxin WrbA